MAVSGCINDRLAAVVFLSDSFAGGIHNQAGSVCAVFLFEAGVQHGRPGIVQLLVDSLVGDGVAVVPVPVVFSPVVSVNSLRHGEERFVVCVRRFVDVDLDLGQYHRSAGRDLHVAGRRVEIGRVGVVRIVHLCPEDHVAVVHVHIHTQVGSIARSVRIPDSQFVLGPEHLYRRGIAHIPRIDHRDQGVGGSIQLAAQHIPGLGCKRVLRHIQRHDGQGQGQVVDPCVPEDFRRNERSAHIPVGSFHLVADAVAVRIHPVIGYGQVPLAGLDAAGGIQHQQRITDVDILLNVHIHGGPGDIPPVVIVLQSDVPQLINDVGIAAAQVVVEVVRSGPRVQPVELIALLNVDQFLRIFGSVLRIVAGIHIQRIIAEEQLVSRHVQL